MKEFKPRFNFWRFYDDLNFYKGFAIIYGVGLVGHLLPWTRPLMLSLTPFVLLLSATIVVLPIFRARNGRLLLWLSTTGVLTFAAEAIGVATGAVFGTYHYTDVLGPALFGVPVIIAFNWMVVILGTLTAAGMVFQRKILVALGASLLTVLFDRVLEPNAMALGYWHWLDETVPLQNYLAWFGLSLLSGVIYVGLGCRHEDRLPAYYLGVMLIYFSVLGSVHGVAFGSVFN